MNKVKIAEQLVKIAKELESKARDRKVESIFEKMYEELKDEFVDSGEIFELGEDELIQLYRKLKKSGRL